MSSRRMRKIWMGHASLWLVGVVILVANSLACSYLSYEVIEQTVELPPEVASMSKIIRVERAEVLGSTLQLKIVRATRVDQTVTTQTEKTVDYRPKKGIVHEGFGIPVVDTAFSLLYIIPDALAFVASSAVMYPAGQFAAIDSTDEEKVESERDVFPLDHASVDVSIEALDLHEQALTDGAGLVTIELSNLSALGAIGPLAVRVHWRTDGLVAKTTIPEEQLADLRSSISPAMAAVKRESLPASGVISEKRLALNVVEATVGSKAGVRSPAAAGLDSYRRVALIIGNSGYEMLPPLANPKRDAADLARSLRAVGFEVILRNELNLSQMKSGLREFAARLGPDTVGFFYYAGHAVQSDGANYLVPLGADIQAQDEIEHEALDLARVLGKMEASQSPIKLVFIDACRNDPFSRFRSASRGLAVTPAPGGTLIAYATAPGDVASDGDGRNSPFARHLISAIDTPGLELKEVISRVQQGVFEETESRQRPWLSSDIFRPFYFQSRAAN